jgi:carbonic anhydrase
LTTPPCLEGVKWLVASTPGLNISIADLNTLKGKIKYSARVPLPLFDMYDQDWVSKRKSDYFPENA